MTVEPRLDFDLVSTEPAPIYMGELPEDYSAVPADIVLNLCGAFPSISVPSPTILTLPMIDTLETEYMPSRAQIEAFCKAAHTYAANEPTYWHCHAGLNRSGIVLATYLHIYRDMKISDIIVMLREKRSPMVLCNNVFERTLRTWYGGPDEQEFEVFDLATYLRERVRRRERGKL